MKQKSKRTLVIALALLVLALVGLWRFLAAFPLVKDSSGGCVVTVYTYGSFLSPLGPGPKLADQFLETHHCKLNFVNTGDGGLLIQKIKSDPARPVDVVVGLDQLQVEEAHKHLHFRKVDWGDFPWAIEGWLESDMTPYDYSPLTFLYHQDNPSPPTQFNDLLNPRWKGKISFQNPRTSTPGLQWMNWLRVSLGDSHVVPFLKALEPQVLVWAPSWSESYGLFMKGQADLTFGYLTSLVYHWQEEKTESIQAAAFQEAHPYQVEYAAILDECRQCEMAHHFLRLLLSEAGQKIIMDRNFMLPMRGGMIADSLYARLPQLHLMKSEQNRLAHRSGDELISMWKQSQ